MTHDELARFAAGKLGITLEWRDGITLVYHLGLFSLTSPELFLKGLGVCPHKVLISVGSDPHERYLAILPPKGDFAMRWYDKPREIPELFWWSLAEIKGGKG